MSGLRGRVAVVTGAGRAGGLGQAIAHQLAADGARVVVHDIGAIKGDVAPAHGVGTRDQLDAVVQSIVAAGGEATGVAADLMSEAGVESVVAQAVATYGRLDILVNNAGIGYLFGPLVEVTQDHWDAVLGVNLRACFFGMKHAAQQMMRQEVTDPAWGRGRIVSIASQAAKSGFALASAYVASKHGLLGLTRSAALEFGPQGITVNAVCPNHVTTGLGAWQNDFVSRARGQTLEQYMAAMAERIPLGRVGRPEDTAAACAFLCSRQAAYVTGEAMNVSGGEEYH